MKEKNVSCKPKEIILCSDYILFLQIVFDGFDRKWYYFFV